MAQHGRLAWSGGYVYPNVILGSDDMMAIDAEMVKSLNQYPGDNKLDVPVEALGQLKVAQEHGLGTMDSIIVEAPANSHKEQEAQF